MRYRTAVNLLSSAILLLACASAPDTRVLGPRAIEPLPAWYETSWAAVLRCAGEDAERGPEDFSRIRFFRVHALEASDGSRLAGLWRWPTVVYIHEDFLDDRNVVEHELLHVATGGNHAHPAFRRCDPLYAWVPDRERG